MRRGATSVPATTVLLTAVAALGLGAGSPATAQDLPRATPESVGLSSERLQEVTQALQGHVDRGSIAGVVAAVGYIATDVALAGWGNTGVWVAFLTMYLWRAGALAFGWRGLVAAVRDGGERATSGG